MYAKTVMDPINAAAIDSMHALFQGVVKQLLQLLFDQQHSREPYSLRKHLKEVEDRISSLTPPSFVQRFPCSISKHGQEWKAHDYKNWFFHYSFATLSDLMPGDYIPGIVTADLILQIILVYTEIHCYIGHRQTRDINVDYILGLYTGTIYRDFIPRLYTGTIYRDYMPGLYTETIYRDYIPGILTADLILQIISVYRKIHCHLGKNLFFIF